MAKWGKGQSGNPGGRPREIADVKELARSHTEAAIQALVAIMNNTDSREASRVAAASAILDRGYGRPSQELRAVIEPPDEMSPYELAKRFAFIFARANADREHQGLLPITFDNILEENAEEGLALGHQPADVAGSDDE